MKTSELRGTALDWAVANCEGWKRELCYLNTEYPNYSENWSLAGPIIEREKIGVWFSDLVIDAETDEVVRGETWYAEGGDGDYVQTGATPLIAAMRCYVASKLGDEVQIPEELTL
jgi:hypothetical protein